MKRTHLKEILILFGGLLLLLATSARAAVSLSGLSLVPSTVYPGENITITYTLSSSTGTISSGTIQVQLRDSAGTILYLFDGGSLPGTGSVVSGNVTVAMTNVATGTYQVWLRITGGEFQIITAPSTYDVSGQAGVLTVTLASTPSQLESMLGLASTPSQQRVVNVISSFCSTQRAEERLQSDCSTLFRAAEGSASDQQGVRDALFAITPDQGSIPVRASQNGVQAQHRNLGRRLSALRAGVRGFDLSGLQVRVGDRLLPVGRLMMAAADTARSDAGGDGLLGSLWESSRWGGFLSGTWTQGSRDGTSLLREFDFDGLSLTGGIDYRFSERFVGGLALGYDRNRSDLGRSTGDLDSRGLNLALYANYYPADNAYVDFMATYGRRDFDQDRRIRYTVLGTPVDQTASADFDGRQWSIAVGGGMEWSRDGWTHGPVARLEYVRAIADGYDETMSNPLAPGGGWALHVGDQANNSLTSQLGWQVQYAWSRPWGVLLPMARLEWFHEFKSGTGNVLGYFLQDPARETFTLDNEEDDSNYFDLSLGVTAQWTQGRSGYVLVQKILGYGGLSLTSVSAGLRWEF